MVRQAAAAAAVIGVSERQDGGDLLDAVVIEVDARDHDDHGREHLLPALGCAHRDVGVKAMWTRSAPSPPQPPHFQACTPFPP
jgi:hypothetical protein